VTPIGRIVELLLEDDFGDDEDYREVWDTAPNDAVLLIPDSENEGDPSPFGITPGYYDQSGLVGLLSRHSRNPEAIQFIADMLESGLPESDQFVQLLRQNKHNPAQIARIVQKFHQSLWRT